MELTFVGTTASIPDVGEDSPCFLVNNRYLFDCGFNVCGGLRDNGILPDKIRTIFFTHMHHDHYIGLAGLLFYFIHNHAIHPEMGRVPLDELTILGPADDVERVVNLACDFLQMDKYYTHLPRPKVVGLTPGDTFETDDLIVRTAAARHPVQALSYRIEEKGGSALAASGDSAYNPHTRELYRGCVALIHDCTMGLNQNLEPPETRKNGHSNLYEAVQCAAEAGIPTLFPVHMAKDYAAYAAANIGDTRGVTITLPERGKVYTL